MRQVEGTEGSAHTTNVVAFLEGLSMEMRCQGEHARKEKQKAVSATEFLEEESQTKEKEKLRRHARKIN
jgi:hypothetical protein